MVTRMVFLKFATNCLFTCLKPSVFPRNGPLIHLQLCLLTFPLLSYSTNADCFQFSLSSMPLPRVYLLLDPTPFISFSFLLFLLQESALLLVCFRDPFRVLPLEFNITPAAFTPSVSLFLYLQTRLEVLWGLHFHPSKKKPWTYWPSLMLYLPRAFGNH